ncbi:MAG TPA: hypothetical protein VFG68_06415 [Fimbriiglobus sp.]|nr:hypothetical protein [Fimbriiglobus sp.]
MRRKSFGLVAVLLVVGVCGGEPPKPKTAPKQPKVYTGKVAPPKDSKGKPDKRKLVLAADDGTSYPLVEDGASRMLFLDSRLRGRPVRLTALRVPDTRKLQVVRVQTVKDGTVYDVDYWCETCQISLDHPGPCFCCGEEVELRERPVR